MTAHALDNTTPVLPNYSPRVLTHYLNWSPLSSPIPTHHLYTTVHSASIALTVSIVGTSDRTTVETTADFINVNCPIVNVENRVQKDVVFARSKHKSIATYPRSKSISESSTTSAKFSFPRYCNLTLFRKTPNTKLVAIYSTLICLINPTIGRTLLNWTHGYANSSKVLMTTRLTECQESYMIDMNMSHLTKTMDNLGTYSLLSVFNHVLLNISSISYKTKQNVMH